VSQLTPSGNYEPNDVKEYRNVETTSPPLMEGQKLESVYVMSAEDAYVDKIRKSAMADFWHVRLGNVSHHKLKVMMQKVYDKGPSTT